MMIIASLSDSARYEMLNPLFRRAFDFIREIAPATLETGRHVLEEDALTVMVNEPVMKKRENARMEVAEKMSANRLSDCANLRRLFAQREAFRKKNWSMLAANHDKSIFYQLDLADAASEFVAGGIMLPKGLPADAPLMKRVHDHKIGRAHV